MYRRGCIIRGNAIVGDKAWIDGNITIGNKAIIKSNRDYLLIGPVGSRDTYTTFIIRELVYGCITNILMAQLTTLNRTLKETMKATNMYMNIWQLLNVRKFD